MAGDHRAPVLVVTICVRKLSGDPTPILETTDLLWPAVRNRMEGATMWLGITGLLVIVICMRQRVRGAFLIGILWVSFFSSRMFLD